MSWRFVDGVPLPDHVGGHPALDFCNTRAGWGAAAPKEYLTSMRALALWVREAGLLTDEELGPLLAPDAHIPDASVAMHRARGLRDAIHACVLGSATPDDWALVASESAAARAASTLVPDPDGGPARWQLSTNPGGSPGGRSACASDLPILAVAAAAEDLLTSPLGTCVAACPGTGCGWVFADPRRRRRWCSMAVCGNRAKARAHARRNRG